MRFMFFAALMTAAVAAAAPADSPSHVFEGKDIFSLQWVTDPQIRPDGHVIAYVRASYDIMTDRPRRSIWLVDTDTGVQTPLATGSGSSYSPRWSPDGKRLAYVASEGGRSQLYVRWMQTEQAARITDLTETPEDLQWSPDGRSIAFIMLTGDERTNLGTPLRETRRCQLGRATHGHHRCQISCGRRGLSETRLLACVCRVSGRWISAPAHFRCFQRGRAGVMDA